MATLKEAEAARALWADRLLRQGAHSISVESEAKGGRGYVVVAWIDKPPAPPLPTSLEISRGGASRAVPLRTRIAEPFAPEAPEG